jgi:hypothetical protein
LDLPFTLPLALPLLPLDLPFTLPLVFPFGFFKTAVSEGVAGSESI